VEVFTAGLSTCRDRAMVLLMLLGGLRAAEVRSLRLADVDMGLRRSVWWARAGGVQPGKDPRRQRTATPIMTAAPPRRSRVRPARRPGRATHGQRTPASHGGSAP